MVRRILLWAPVLAVAAALSAAPAEAKGGKGGHKGWKSSAAMRHHGPPSWAPAYGYRRKAARSGSSIRIYPTTRSYTYERTIRSYGW